MMSLLLLLVGCKDAAPDSAAPPPGCDTAPTLTWQGWGDGFFATYCRACHSETAPDRRGAPVGIDFNTLAQVRDQEALIRDSVLVRASMPLGGGVYPEDLALLEIFLDCSL